MFATAMNTNMANIIHTIIMAPIDVEGILVATKKPLKFIGKRKI